MDITWKEAGLVWLSILWRSFVFCFLAGIIGALISAAIRIIGIMVFDTHDIMGAYRLVPGFILCVPANIMAVKGALKADYSNFMISFVSYNRGVSAQEEFIENNA